MGFDIYFEIFYCRTYFIVLVVTVVVVVVVVVETQNFASLRLVIDIVIDIDIYVVMVFFDCIRFFRFLETQNFASLRLIIRNKSFLYVPQPLFIANG